VKPVKVAMDKVFSDAGTTGLGDMLSSTFTAVKVEDMSPIGTVG